MPILTSRWSRVTAIAVTAYILFLASSCRLPEPVLDDRGDRAAMPVDSTTIYVVRHGWHAGIAVRRAHVPDDRLPRLDGVPTTRYLELGWGEKHYYPNPEPGVWTLTRAGAWPTGSVVHAVPVSSSIPDAFPQQPVVPLRVSARDLDRLVAFFRASLEVDSTGAAVPAAPGYYSGSRFFASGLRYHLFQNCNHWAAEALEAAGCSTARWRTLTVGRVLAQARDCSEKR